MKSHVGMHHFVLLVAWAALGGCWPTFEAEQKLKFKIARDAHPTGSSPTNSSTISTKTLLLSKEINTTLTGLTFLLVVGTYWLLVKYTTELTHNVILPSKFLEDNINAILSLTWPKRYIGSPEDAVDMKKGPWVLFYRRKVAMSTSDQGPFYEGQGSHDFDLLGSFDGFKSSTATFKAFSPVMRSLVQIAIWNSISFWIVLVMIVNTVAYNGFISHNITNDSRIRLVLVSIYAVANCGFQIVTIKLLYRNFTFVLFQACWTIISKEFLFLDNAIYTESALEPINERFSRKYRDCLSADASRMDLTSLNSELLGTTESLDSYRVLREYDQVGTFRDNVFDKWPADDKRRDSHFKPQVKSDSDFDKWVKPLREAEIKAYEKATDSALEKALANVAVLLGICIASTLAPWTSSQTINATGVQVGSYANATFTQLGSYALLLSVSTGLLALVSGITQLSSATDAARMLLLLQEKTIEATCFRHSDVVFDKSSLEYPPQISFSSTKGIPEKSHLTPIGHWRSTSLLGKLPCLLFGPALMLIPRLHRHYKRNEYSSHGNLLFFTVEDLTFMCNPATGEIQRKIPNTQEQQQS